MFLLWISFIIHDRGKREREKLNEERIEKRILHRQTGETLRLMSLLMEGFIISSSPSPLCILLLIKCSYSSQRSPPPSFFFLSSKQKSKFQNLLIKIRQTKSFSEERRRREREGQSSSQVCDHTLMCVVFHPPS